MRTSRKYIIRVEGDRNREKHPKNSGRAGAGRPRQGSRITTRSQAHTTNGTRARGRWEPGQKPLEKDTFLIMTNSRRSIDVSKDASGRARRPQYKVVSHESAAKHLPRLSQAALGGGRPTRDVALEAHRAAGAAGPDGENRVLRLAQRPRVSPAAPGAAGARSRGARCATSAIGLVARSRASPETPSGFAVHDAARVDGAGQVHMRGCSCVSRGISRIAAAQSVACGAGPQRRVGSQEGERTGEDGEGQG